MSVLRLFISDHLYLNATPLGKNRYVINLSNGETVHCEESPDDGAWKIEGKMFSTEHKARLYLERVIAEKLTGSDLSLHFAKKPGEPGGVTIEQIDVNAYTARLPNGETISIEKDPEYEGKQWAWKIGEQIFSQDRYAGKYFFTLAYEKLTKKRVIFHKKKDIPVICGVNGAACRHKEAPNSALCEYCPIADQFYADRDNLELIYAVK